MPSAIINDLTELSPKTKKLTFSEVKDKSFEFSKVTVRPFLSKGETLWQLEQFRGARGFHLLTKTGAR